MSVRESQLILNMSRHIEFRTFVFALVAYSIATANGFLSAIVGSVAAEAGSFSLLLAFFLVLVKKHRYRCHIAPVSIVLAYWVAVAFMAFLWILRVALQDVNIISFGTILYMVPYMGLLFLLRYRLEIPERDISAITLALVVVLLIHLSYSFLGGVNLHSSIDTQNRARGLFRGTINYSTFLFTILFLLHFLSNRIHIYIILFISALVVCGMYLAGSRSGFLAMSPILISMVLAGAAHISRNYNRMIVGSFLLILFGAFFILILLSPSRLFEFNGPLTADGDRLARMLQYFAQNTIVPQGFAATSSGAGRFYPVISFESFILNQMYQFGFFFPVLAAVIYSILRFKTLPYSTAVGLISLLAFTSVSQGYDSFLLFGHLVVVLAMIGPTSENSH